MTRETSSEAPFSTRTVGLMIIIGVFAFCAVMTLIAFSDDLRPKNRAGAHPYSTAATGYGGWVSLLERAGANVRVSRIERTIEDREPSLLILTLQGVGMGELEPYDIQGPALVVLPKWHAQPDYAKPIWQRDTNLADKSFATGALHIFDETGEIETTTPPARLHTPFGIQEPALNGKMQLIRSDELETVINVRGDALLAKLPYHDIYILSDPDLVNTFGLAEFEHAKFAVGLANWLMAYDEDMIIFDATLHGFVRSENIFQAALSPPFLGAVLTAFAAAVLLGWSASLRFGAPDREDRAIALGKQALVDNSAGLFAMTHREPRLAPGYLALTRRATAKDVGAPKTLADAELRALYDRMSKANKNASLWSDLADPMTKPAASRDDLVNKARALWTWRKETTHGRD